MNTHGVITARPDIQPRPAPATEQRLSCRERVDTLLDPGSFVEFGSQAQHHSEAFAMHTMHPLGDGVVTGVGELDSRPVCLFAQDSTVFGGSLGEVHAAKIARITGHAERARTPLIGLIDSGGARIQEGVAALDGYGAIFRSNVRLSGRVPQISVILGPCAGGAVYSPALTDIVIMHREHAYMFLTGPKVTKAVTYEDVSAAELGGAAVHSQLSGVVHLVADSTAHALRLTSTVLSYLPSSCWGPLPETIAAGPDPLPDIPADHRLPYDVKQVVRGLVDAASFLELQPRFARNIVIGFARLQGRPIGVIANQPRAIAGALDICAAEKGARFVRMCDAFGLPLLTLVDTPGFLPGTRQESGGVIRKGAKLLYAFSEATVPRVTVVLRKAFGGAYIVMNSKSLGADAVFAWPGAELAVMGAEGAVDIIHRRVLDAEPERRGELIACYRAEAMNSTISAARLSIDEIIEPADTRRIIAATVASLCRTPHHGYRHDNLPQ
jgi:propionyl-CoA carboxylase beta chain